MLPALVRRRALYALLGIVTLSFAPIVARYLWPSAVTFIPPPDLVLIIGVSVALALMVWRTKWVVRFLTSQAPPPDKLADWERTASDHRIVATIGLFAAACMVALWLRSVL